MAILWILVNTCRQIFRRLMDGVDDDTVQSIETIAASTAGVESVDRVRARWTGHRLEAEVDISVDGTLSVAAGHAIAEEVHHELLHGIPHLDHATVHVNPRHDELDLLQAHQRTAHHSSASPLSSYL